MNHCFCGKSEKQSNNDNHLSMLGIYSAFHRHLIYMTYSLWNTTYTNTPQCYSRAWWHAPQTAPETSDNTVKPKRCLSMKALSVKLTPSLECHRTAWRHGAASFMKPVPCTAPNEPWWILHRQSIPGEAVKKTLLYLGAGTAQTDSNCCDSKARRERERGMFTISTWQQSKLHTSWSHLLRMAERHKEQWTLQLKLNKLSELC